MEKNTHLSNLQTIDNLYQEFQKNPDKVDPSWARFFEGMEFATKEFESAFGENDDRIAFLFENYRRYGHLYTHINPIDPKEPELPVPLQLSSLNFSEEDLSKSFSTLGLLPKKEATLREIIDALQKIYCSRIGFEYMESDDPELKKFVQEKVEPSLDIRAPIDDKKLIMEDLNNAELFESFLHMKYAGQTRFSLEGGETMIPLLSFLIDKGADFDIQEIVIGIAHRGRLNLLANIFEKPYSLIFHEFEAHYLPLALEGTSDVKYHRGYSSTLKSRNGKEVHLHLAANPSHLESVDSVVLGQTKAKQIHKNDGEKNRIVPILIHGDAAVAAQGVVYESMSMMHVDGYGVGGTIHIVINNQIGFTTLPQEGRSSRYPSDIAKAYGCPVFHVNAEDPEACIFAALLALEIRQKFALDVFIDLNCYRKFGHNEGDDPFFTQPLEYKRIHEKKTLREIYRDELFSQGVLEKELAEKYEQEFRECLRKHFEKMQTFTEKPPEPPEIFGTTWQEYTEVGEEDLRTSFETKVPLDVLQNIAEESRKIPETFHLHKKIAKWVEDRRNKCFDDPKKPVIDWPLAEHLAFGSLVLQKVPIRLSGQDCQRGTFNQRHEVFVDQNTAEKYFPLQHLMPDNVRFDVLNSPLSEFAVMGFEYGYSLSSPQTLVLWEAQYGDFVNGAQVIIDQYITTGEMKWNRRSGLVLLLPHGYEGAGPEHSSARIERFLQQTGHDNIAVVYPSTPANFFHLLRRQAIRKMRKPLIVFTPKSLLRLNLCTSPLVDFTEGKFQPVIDDPEKKQKVRKLLFCTGKIYYDLLKERLQGKGEDIAIVRVEELHPFPKEEIEKALKSYKAEKVCWIQEEPRNMGAWTYIVYRFREELGISPHYIGRDWAASPASGSHMMFKKGQEKILAEAFA